MFLSQSVICHLFYFLRVFLTLLKRACTAYYARLKLPLTGGSNRYKASSTIPTLLLASTVAQQRRFIPIIHTNYLSIGLMLL